MFEESVSNVVFNLVSWRHCFGYSVEGLSPQYWRISFVCLGEEGTRCFRLDTSSKTGLGYERESAF